MLINRLVNVMLVCGLMKKHDNDNDYIRIFNGASFFLVLILLAFYYSYLTFASKKKKKGGLLLFTIAKMQR